MLNHTYTSVKNANLVDCGKKQHIPSQPSPLLKDNFLGEFRTELDKKKVLANLGIATDLSLEWEYIKGDIGRSKALMDELDSRTKYASKIDGFTKTLIEGVQYLETVIGGDLEAEEKQNERIKALEDSTKELVDGLSELKTYLEETIEVDVEELQDSLGEITEKVNNITDLIKVSDKEGNALVMLTEDDVEEGQTPGLYVPDLSEDVTKAAEDIKNINKEVTDIKESLDDFVTREELGGGDFDFVSQDDFDQYTEDTDEEIEAIKEDLRNTVKTGEDGHVDTLYVNQISKNNDDGNIKITDSFEMESGVPLDIRFVVKNIEQLHSLKPNVCYAGMGVIVSDQASLYILREPLNGVIDEDYIKDPQGINWKCPEDLVIEVITQEEYDRKLDDGSINPNMFYYIHEEVVEEPQRKDFDTDEEYAEALDKWLRVLQQKYMSAVWGQEIETLVAGKASTTAVKSLEQEIQRLSTIINSIQGGSSEINLKDLHDQVQQNTSNIDELIKEDGTIPTIQKDVADLSKTLTSDYVTIESVTVDDPTKEFIFVKKSVFDTYTKTHAQAIANKIETKEVAIDSNTLTSSGEDLLLNGEKLALDKQVPVIEVIDSKAFEDLEIEEEKYYYVYDETERYVLDSEFSQYKTLQTKTTQTLSQSVSDNRLAIGILENLTTENKNSLVYAVNELHNYVSQISQDLDTLITGEGIISSMQAAINNLQKEIASKYVTIEAITTEDPEVEYIFVKKSEFETYKADKDLALATSVATEKVITNQIELGEGTLVQQEDGVSFNDEKIAFVKQIPVIEVVDSKTFETKEDIDEETYYYVYDETERYVPDSEFTEYKTAQNKTNTTLTENITKNQTSIGELINLTTDNKNTLVLAINELVSKINDLTNELSSLKEKVNGLETI